MIVEAMTYLGPARVVSVYGPAVRLALHGREVAATLALSGPYRPVENDVVLAIGSEDRYFVLGIIAGTGKTIIAAPGGLELRVRGKIDMMASDEVRIASARVAVQAGRLELASRSVVERFGDVWRRIKGVFQSRIGRVRETVAGSYHLRAERIVEQADKDVKIDGEKINLG